MGRKGGRIEVVAQVHEERRGHHDDKPCAAREQTDGDQLGGTGKDKGGHRSCDPRWNAAGGGQRSEYDAEGNDAGHKRQGGA